jgi:CDP-6-deoxy-D-xylo-4-hexulose-3-dehydrase
MFPVVADRPTFNWPLMRNNISRQDLDAVIHLLQSDDPILTQSQNVLAFEEEWSTWLGVKHSVFVNSGSSANQITMAALRESAGPGSVIVPPLTWVSDITAVLQAGFEPIFVDIDPRTLGMDNAQVIQKLRPDTRAVFITHVLGYNALTPRLLAELEARRVPLIEDACEAHGATFGGRKVGSLGLMSNFSFYYAHHLSTIEGGMVCTNDRGLYEMLRMLRAHGMVRESSSNDLKQDYYDRHRDLNPDFIFAFPAYNVRSTEINAVIGRSQLKRLDVNNCARTRNLQVFLDNLDSDLFQTDFETRGNCNYALSLVLRQPDDGLRDRVMATLRSHGVEFRRGTAGGGNQLRQPYLRRLLGDDVCLHYPHADHVHFYGFYIGNYPGLDTEQIMRLCGLLNSLK